MAKFNQQLLEDRIFHLDTECYFLYLGSDIEDETPFLRVGNCKNISEELHRMTGHVIVTDSHTGNPFLEVLLAQNNNISYLGDIDIIDHYKQFFKSLNLSDNNLNDFRSIKNGANRHTLYFYNSGNIHLKFDGNDFFDLQKKEEEDSHFVSLANKIKTLFLSNPIRYTQEEMQSPYFFLSEQKEAYFFNKEEGIALDIKDNYFSSLAKSGLDPDRISSVVATYKNINMEESDSEGLLQHIKRRSLRDKPIRIITTHFRFSAHLTKLFRHLHDGEGGSWVKPILLTDQKSWDHKAFSIKRDKKVLQIESNFKFNIPYSSLEGGSTPRLEGWRFSINRESIAYRTLEGEEHSINIYTSYPYMVNNTLLDQVKIKERYFQFFHSYLESWSSKDNLKGLYDFECIFSSPSFSLSSLWSSLLTDKFSSPGLENLFLQNVVSYLSLLNLSEENSNYLSYIKNYIASLPRPSIYLPIIGDLFIFKEKPVVFYRVSSHRLNSFTFEKAKNIAKKIDLLCEKNDSYFKEEQKRLEALVYSLIHNNKKDVPLLLKKTAIKSQNMMPKETASVSKKRDERLERENKEKPIQTWQNSTLKKGVPKRGFSIPNSVFWGALIALLLGGLLWGLINNLDLSENKKTAKILRSESPITENPITESPVIESPVIESLITENPVIENPVIENPVIENPVTENPITESPITENPITENPITENPVTENPITESPITESPITENPITENPITENPVTENPITENPITENPITESPITENPVKENPITESPVTESPITESPITENPVTENPITESPVIEIQTEVRPKSKKEAEAYLTIDDINITLVDIHLVSNAIAVKNGYRDLDYKVFTGGNPDWIYAGNKLILPDNLTYIIERGDTIWFIASRLIRRDVEKNLVKINGIEKKLNRLLNEDDKDILLKELKDIESNSMSEQLSNKVEKILSFY